MDKLTSTVTVKFSDDDIPVLRAQAESHGMEVSEYVRHLVSQDRLELQRKWSALDRIFGQSKPVDKGYRSAPGTTGVADK